MRRDAIARRRCAVRELGCGAEPTYERLAGASGLCASTVRKQAEQEGWALPAGGEVAPEARLDRVMDFLMREVERIGAVSQADGAALDKGRLDGVWAMIRTIEKVESFSRERSRERQQERDGELADVLGRIDARIVELARELARELAAGMGEGEPFAA